MRLVICSSSRPSRPPAAIRALQGRGLSGWHEPPSCWQGPRAFIGQPCSCRARFPAERAPGGGQLCSAPAQSGPLCVGAGQSRSSALCALPAQGTDATERPVCHKVELFQFVQQGDQQAGRSHGGRAAGVAAGLRASGWQEGGGDGGQSRRHAVPPEARPSPIRGRCKAAGSENQPRPVASTLAACELEGSGLNSPTEMPQRGDHTEAMIQRVRRCGADKPQSRSARRPQREQRGTMLRRRGCTAAHRHCVFSFATMSTCSAEGAS